MVKVKAYTSEDCKYCVLLKEWLTKNNIPFENLDIDKDENAHKEFESYKMPAIPLLIIENGENDETKIMGFNESMLEQELIKAELHFHI